jgi:hypothetical protein
MTDQITHPLKVSREYGGKTYHGYMNEADVKAALGLPKKLPPRVRDGRMHYVGCIQGVTIWDYGQKPGRRTHRLHALIRDRYVPVGRLHQYKGA